MIALKVIALARKCMHAFFIDLNHNPEENFIKIKLCSGPFPFMVAMGPGKIVSLNATVYLRNENNIYNGPQHSLRTDHKSLRTQL